MRLRPIHVISLCLLGAAVAGARLTAAAPSYAQVGDIMIGGPLPATWDYLNIDSATKKMFVSHGAEFVVIDLVTEKVVGRIPGVQRSHGSAFAPNGHGFGTSGGDNKAVMFDTKTLAVLGMFDAGTGPDAIMWEPKQKEIYALDHGGHAVTVLNPDTGATIATIPLAGTAETGQSDPGLGRVYVNIEDKDSIDVIDVATHKVIANWPVAPGDGPTGMAIDTTTHRLFVGAGKFMVMMDASTGKVVASVPICGGTDASAYDPTTKLAFSSCGDGKTTVAQVNGDSMTVIQTIETPVRSKTMALDPVTHKIYFGAAKPAAADPSAPARKGGAGLDPNSFHVLVFGMK